MTAPMGGPPYNQPTPASYPGAHFFPDVNETAVPFRAPLSGGFLYAVGGVVYWRNSAGETAIAGGGGGAALTSPTILGSNGGAFLFAGSNAIGADAPAGALTIIAPLSTGIAAPGGILMQIGAYGVSGATPQVATTVWQAVNSAVNAGVALPVFNVPVSAGQWYGGYTTAAVNMRPDEASQARVGAVGDNMDSAAFRSYLFHNTLTFGPGLLARRALGTGAVPLPPTTGAVLMTLAAAGYVSGAGQFFSANTVAIRMLAAENYTATNQGTQIDFATTKIGGVARTVCGLFDSDGSFKISPNTAATTALKFGANSALDAAGVQTGALTNLPADVVSLTPIWLKVIAPNGAQGVIAVWQ